MQVIETRQFEETALAEAASIVRHGGLVAFPTETVFGLGADATEDSAVAKIFSAKGRPSDNPLIAHLADVDEVDRWAETNAVARRLFEAFAPGPISIVLPKREQICDTATAGLPTVAIRVPDHSLARRFLALVGKPVVAPSANTSGRPSATRWQDVLEDLNGKIDGVICWNQTAIGLESTVVDVTSSTPILLRPGGISYESLMQVVPNIQLLSAGSKLSDVNSPGLRHKHYQPRALVRLFDSNDRAIADSGDAGRRVAVIGVDLDDECKNGKTMVANHHTVDSYAASLFEFFRECDRASIDLIWCEQPRLKGIGRALMDRLLRAAAESHPVRGSEPDND